MSTLQASSPCMPTWHAVAILCAVFAALTVLYSLLFLAELVRYHRTLARWKRGEIGAGSVKNKGPAIVGFGGEKSGEEEGGLARKGEKG